MCKVQDFFVNNNIELLTQDPTLSSSKEINRAINNSTGTSLLSKVNIRFLKVPNPQVPILRGLHKIHKYNRPFPCKLHTFTGLQNNKKLNRIITNDIIFETVYN